MKTKINLKRFFAIALLAIGLFVFTNAYPKTNVEEAKPIPAWGCRYTGNSADHCIYGQYWIINCTPGSTSCGFEPIPGEN